MDALVHPAVRPHPVQAPALRQGAKKATVPPEPCVPQPRPSDLYVTNNLQPTGMKANLKPSLWEYTPLPDKRLSFKEMCAKFDVTPRTLRYYEYIELLSPEKEGRSRFYHSREVARMTLILRGRRFGFSLEEIRRWLEIYETKGNTEQMDAWISMADRQLEALAEQAREMNATIEDLRKLRDEVAKQRAAG